MLILMLAALVQESSPVKGPWVDFSTRANRVHADRASILMQHDRVRLTVTVERPEGARRERDYWFDCAASTYSSATWRVLNAAGEVEMHGHSQLRPTYRPVSGEVESYRALACDGDDGGRPTVAELPR